MIAEKTILLIFILKKLGLILSGYLLVIYLTEYL